MISVVNIMFFWFAATNQLMPSDQVALIGVWTVTDYTERDRFNDIWELKQDGVFNELKYMSDGNEALVIDENGLWFQDEGILTIEVRGEATKNGDQAHVTAFDFFFGHRCSFHPSCSEYFRVVPDKTDNGWYECC